MGSLQQAFHDTGAPALSSLQGRYEATLAGPTWFRGPALMVVHRTGMPGWWGKEFALDDSGTALEGRNLVRVGDALHASLPMHAVLGSSRIDRRPALVLTYGSTAPLPWRRVTDEVRPLGNGILIGLSFGLLVPPGGSPFLLRPDPSGGAATPGASSPPSAPGGSQ